MERTDLGPVPEQVVAQLEPGERVLCSKMATQLTGHNGVGGDSAPRAELGMDWDPFAGGITVNPEWTAAALGGVNAGGAAGSIADTFTRQLEKHNCTMLLTDRRLALFADVAGLLTFKKDVRIIASVDRRFVVDIVRKRRLLQWGRVLVTFADGSWVMAMTGVFFGVGATRLIRIFHQSGGGRAAQSAAG